MDTTPNPSQPSLYAEGLHAATVGRIRSRHSFVAGNDSVFSYENGHGDEDEGGGDMIVGHDGISGDDDTRDGMTREMKEKVARLVEEHGTIETCLTELPDDIELCGIWEGLVMSFRILFPMAIKHAERIGEELQVRLDRSGNEHPKLVCRYSGKARRRVSDAVSKRRRHTVRANCIWGATLKVLNINRLKADNPGKSPSELKEDFIIKVSKWCRKHTGHVPAPLCEAPAVDSVGLDGALGQGGRNERVEMRMRDDVIKFKNAGMSDDEVMVVLLMRYKGKLERVGRCDDFRALFPKILGLLNTQRQSRPALLP